MSWTIIFLPILGRDDVTRTTSSAFGWWPVSALYRRTLNRADHTDPIGGPWHRGPRGGVCPQLHADRGSVTWGFPGRRWCWPHQRVGLSTTTLILPHPLRGSRILNTSAIGEVKRGAFGMRGGEGRTLKPGMRGGVAGKPPASKRRLLICPCVFSFVALPASPSG